MDTFTSAAALRGARSGFVPGAFLTHRVPGDR